MGSAGLCHGPCARPGHFADWPRAGDAYVAATDAQLVQWLDRAAVLAQSLLNQAAVDFDAQGQQALAALPSADSLSTEVQRLDVFNGFLLSANLDALFDKFLISFSDAGEMLIGSSVSLADRHLLGLSNGLKLHWLAPGHGPYLLYHRDHIQTVNGWMA